METIEILEKDHLSHRNENGTIFRQINFSFNVESRVLPFNAISYKQQK